MMKHIHHQAHEGAINPREENKLLHELEHDAQRLRLGVGPALDGKGGVTAGPISIAAVCKFMLAFKEHHDEMIKRVDESNNYSDLRTPWCSLQKIHGDMEHEKASYTEADKADKSASVHGLGLIPKRKYPSARSIFKLEKRGAYGANATLSAVSESAEHDTVSVAADTDRIGITADTDDGVGTHESSV